jgi:hypothetical protein
MKSKLILGFALVLCVGLLSCSTAAQHCSDVQPLEANGAAKVKLKFVKVDSEETDGQDNYGENAVDGNPDTYWHTQWQGTSPGLPHEIIIELCPPSVIKGFTYLPRKDVSDHGTIKDYEFYVSDDGRNFGQPVKKGVFEPGKGKNIETFEPIKCSFVKLRAISEINGLPWTSAAEIGVIQSLDFTPIDSDSTHYFTSSKEDQGELENLMRQAKLSPARTKKLKALFESTNRAGNGVGSNLTKQVSKHAPLDFLADIPSMKGVSLKMSEAELLDIIRQQKLDYTLAIQHGDSMYYVRPKEHVVVIITFREGHCGGIQRLRD